MTAYQNETAKIEQIIAETDLNRAPAPYELPAQKCDIFNQQVKFDFKTTEEIEPLDEIVGQEKAMTALEVGLGIPQEGYNIFVAGLTGTGKMETIQRSLKKRIADSKCPSDWVYVHNFDNPDAPWAIKMQPGHGKILEKQMTKLVERLREHLPHAFREEDFSREKEGLGEKYQQQLQEHIENFRNKANEKGFEVTTSPDGRLSFVPLVDGKPAEKQSQIEKLPEQHKKQLDEHERQLAREAARISQQQHEIMHQLSEDVREAEKRFAAGIVGPMIERIKQKHQDNARVQKYLDKVLEHILNNLSDFQQQKGQQSQMMALMGGPMNEPEFLEYQVNVIVDHTESQTAPVIIEEAPTYVNLFGSIERTVDQRGRLITNFTQIKAGSLLRANDGYLVFNLEDALTEPFVYKSIKRALKAGEIQIESFNPFAPFSVGTLRPESIRLTTKVVVLGRPIIYHLLQLYDEEFASIFKIKADFGTEMDMGDQQQHQYSRFIKMLVRQEQLRDFEAGGCGEVIRFASRQTGKNTKLLTRFSEVADLLREANYFASKDALNGKYVTDTHVRQALQSRVFRSNRIAEKIRELIAEGTLQIDITDRKIGQINGLAIINLGDYVFGRPNRVTVSVGLGSEGLVNIEREAKLSGSTHDKGVLILAGYLRNTYGKNKPLALSAGICFEQSYSGVEGDSASSTELYALLSNLADVPLRQDIAVTGSVDQWGKVQAIGGVNDKIEGFYDICNYVGLTGRQGVCIPASNVRNLVLRHDVKQAVEQGNFHIYPIETIEQGLELLTGVQAGSIDQKGTLHWRIDQRLEQMAKSLRQFAASAHTSNAENDQK